MMMRSGQHNNNKRRGRNRGRHSGGGGGGHSGGHNGNPANRVFDSNGPDVKLRGTAQTIAEKYMQLGRDAQLSGDGVMAESYYQHAEHYYRLWLANQPAGQPIVFNRRMSQDEEFEDEGTEGAGEAAEGEEIAAEGAEGEAPAAGEEATPSEGAAEGEFQPRRQQRPPREFREGGEGQRDGNRDGNREGGRRERFRNRWQRGERDGGREGGRDDVAAQGEGENFNRQPRERQERFDRQDRGDRYERSERPERAERPERSERVERSEPRERSEAQDDNWEAPSFLRRPAPRNDADDLAQADADKE